MVKKNHSILFLNVHMRTETSILHALRYYIIMYIAAWSVRDFPDIPSPCHAIAQKELIMCHIPDFYGASPCVKSKSVI